MMQIHINKGKKHDTIVKSREKKQSKKWKKTKNALHTKNKKMYFLQKRTKSVDSDNFILYN